MNKVLLPAINTVCPFEGQNFGVSAEADVERFRNGDGQIHPIDTFREQRAATTEYKI